MSENKYAWLESTICAEKSTAIGTIAFHRFQSYALIFFSGSVRDVKRPGLKKKSTPTIREQKTECSKPIATGNGNLPGAIKCLLNAMTPEEIPMYIDPAKITSMTGVAFELLACEAAMSRAKVPAEGQSLGIRKWLIIDKA